MKYKRRHVIIVRLLFLAAIGICILFFILFIKADDAYGRLQAGGALPAEYTVNGIDVSESF